MCRALLLLCCLCLMAANKPDLLLAEVYRDAIAVEEYWVSEKLDGVRAYWDGKQLVSRGGEKLQGFIDQFSIHFTGGHVLDVGASTGGFTDCALQAGAADVVCIDVGRAQLHAKLLGDPRVSNIEKLNARRVTAADLPRATYDAAVMDLSFISLRQVLPAVWPLVCPGGRLIALVKPQFEAGKAEVDKGRGIIRDVAVQEAVLGDIRTFALTELPGAELIGTMDSPIVGTDGNREFLLGLRRSMPQ